jgi:hypothetical protein
MKLNRLCSSDKGNETDRALFKNKRNFSIKLLALPGPYHLSPSNVYCQHFPLNFYLTLVSDRCRTGLIFMNKISLRLRSLHRLIPRRQDRRCDRCREGPLFSIAKEIRHVCRIYRLKSLCWFCLNWVLSIYSTKTGTKPLF